MKRKKRRNRKSSGLKGFLLLVILVGVGIGFLSLFHEELSRLARPWLERRGFVGEKKGVILYFSDGQAKYLVGEKREIKKGEDVEQEATELLQELIQGPKGQFLPTLPSKTRLLSIQLEDGGTARVNFNQSFTRDHPGGSSAEIMTVYSVVNSLALNFPEVKRVQFLVEGKEIETITGHLSLIRPLSPRPDLIKSPG
jgi:spore germination protein GerM